MRTIPGISENLKPLDDAINNLFIPALFGNEIDEKIRDILSLPIRDGGLGIKNMNASSKDMIHIRARPQVSMAAYKELWHSQAFAFCCSQ